MNAWIVIRDGKIIMEQITRSGKAEVAKRYFEEIISVSDDIRIAEKYYFGEFDKLYSDFIPMTKRWEKRNKSKLRPFIDMHAFCKLKHPCMWLECEINKHHIGPRENIPFKIGILVKRLNEEVIIANIFSYVNKKWIMDFYKVYFSLGKPMIETEIMKELGDLSALGSKTTQYVIAPLFTDKVILDTIYADDNIEELKSHSSFLYIALLTLNCRNIGTITHAPNKKKIDKRMSKSEKTKFRYKTLILKENPGKTKYYDELKNKGSRHIRPLSLVEGYWRVYTKERPLFGNPKLYGIMWVKDHQRGDIERGIIVNDRKVITNRKI